MFGPVEVGTQRNTVQVALGDPTDLGLPPTTLATADIWKYGDFEFHFFDDTVISIFTDWFEVPTAGPALKIDPWILHAGLVRSDFQQALTQADLPFTVRPSRHNEDETEIITAGDVCFAFRNRENEWGSAGLCAFHTLSR